MLEDVSASKRLPRGLMFRWAFWFVVANAAVMTLVLLNFLTTMALPDTALARLFLGLSLPGHSFTLTVAAFPVIAAAILAYPRRNFVFGLAVILKVLLILVVVVDSLVFAQYRFHLNGMVWNLLTSGAATDVLPVTEMLWLVLLVALGLLALLEWLLAVMAWRWVLRARRSYGVAVAAAIVFALVAGHGLHAWANASSYTEITSQVRYLPAYMPLTARKLLARMGVVVAKGGAKLNLSHDNSVLKYPMEPLRFQEVDKKKNLVLIVIDSWRYDALTPEITPGIWKFSEKSLRFDDNFSSGNCTRFGIFGLFYGLYGTYWHSFLVEERSPILIQELERQSYRMGIFASAPLVNPEFDKTVFSGMRSKISLRQEGEKPYQRDRTITDKMLAFVAAGKADQPFFGFMFYDAPHAEDHPEHRAPFQPAAKEVNRLTLNNGTDPIPVLNKYKNSINYVDSMVQEVLAALAKKGVLNNTVVAITGDHGQEFNDLKMNYWGHNGNFSKFQTQTPLVMYWPGKEPRLYSHRTSNVDLVPTLMREMLGCSSDPWAYSNGRCLFDTSERPYVLVSSWDTFGIIERDRTTVSLHAGEIDILDDRYRQISGARTRPEITKDAMDGIGRFFAR